VVLGAPDGRITPRAGLHLVAKLDTLLGITATIDDAVPTFKHRKRGLMLGGVMVSLAETMLAAGISSATSTTSATTLPDFGFGQCQTCRRRRR